MSEDAMGNKELLFESLDLIRIKLEHTIELFGKPSLENKVSRAEEMRRLSGEFKQAVNDFLGPEV